MTCPSNRTADPPTARLARAGLLLGLLLAAPAAHATVRPDPLSPEPGCERWFGRAGGNDPSVEIDLVLCPKGGQLEGQLQWSSLQSGWNLRAVAGRWSSDGARLELADTRILKEKANAGWRFCTIDRYELEPRGPDSLEGHYVSSRCSDRASVSLTRAAPPAPADAGKPRASATPEGPTPTTRASAVPSATAGPRPGNAESARCGCRVPGARTSPPGNTLASLSLLGAAGLALRRRARAGRRR